MSDKNLHQQVILSAVDKFTRPFQSAAASMKKLAAAVQNSRIRLKELDMQAGKIDGFRQAGFIQIALLDQAEYRVSVLKSHYRELHQSMPLQLTMPNEAGFDARSSIAAQRELQQSTDDTRQELERQQASLKRLKEQQMRFNKAREPYSQRESLNEPVSAALTQPSIGSQATNRIDRITMIAAAAGASSRLAIASEDRDRDLPQSDLREPLASVTDALNKGLGPIQQWADACREMASRLRSVALVLPAIANGVGQFAVTASAAIGPLFMLGTVSRLLANRGLPMIAAVFAKIRTALDSVNARFALLAENVNEAFRELAGDRAIKAAEAIERLKRAFDGQQDVQKGGGILSALREGVMGSITEQAQKAMNLLILAFINPAAAIRELSALLAGLRTSFGVISAVISALGSGIGSLFASLTGAISSAGGVVLWLISGPFAMLRMAWTALSALMLALFTPIGGVIAALAAAGIAIWMFWEPINAFIGGVVEGFIAAIAPVRAVFAPLKPMFQSIGGSLKELWGWFIQILTPVKFTAEALDNAAVMGAEFGQVLGDAFNGFLKPLLIVHEQLDWLLEKLGLVGKKTEEVKLPAKTAKKAYALNDVDDGTLPETAGWWYPGAPLPLYDDGGTIQRGQYGIVGERGPEIVSGPAYVTSRRRTAALASLVVASMGAAAAPVEMVPLHPMSLAVEHTISPTQQAATSAAVHIETHAPITIYAQPGQEAQDIAREVARQLDERERQALARARSNYSDRGGYES